VAGVRDIRVPVPDRYVLFGLVLLVLGAALVVAGFSTWPI
jgi:hypothetical protein